jgi:hypothetical protein
VRLTSEPRAVRQPTTDDLARSSVATSVARGCSPTTGLVDFEHGLNAAVRLLHDVLDGLCATGNSTPARVSLSQRRRAAASAGHFSTAFATHGSHSYICDTCA